MVTRYIQVQSLSNLFSPALRAFGTVAIIGDATGGPTETPTLFTNPDDAGTTFPGTLSDSIKIAFRQTPGPSLVYGVRTKTDTTTGPNWASALATLVTVDVQLVALANTPLDATSGNPGSGGATPGAIVQL